MVVFELLHIKMEVTVSEPCDVIRVINMINTCVYLRKTCVYVCYNL